MTTRQVFWLPFIAQDRLRLLSNHKLYCSYPSSDADIFYHISSEVLNPGIAEKTSPKGLIFELHITLYHSEIKTFDRNSGNPFGNNRDTDDKKNTDDPKKDNPYHPPRYNRIKKIPKEVYEQFRTNFESCAERKWYKRPTGYLSDYIIAMKVYRMGISKISETWTITLTLEDYTSGGIAVFKVETDADRQLVESINRDIYRQIKFHFHEDHYHSPGGIGCTPLETDTDIHKKDNDALLHYIDFFHDTLTLGLHTLYEDYREVDSRQNLTKRLLKKRKLKRKKLKFYEDCHNLIGRWVFVQTLLGSPENAICRSYASREAKGRKYAAMARNIANVRQGAEAIRDKVKHHHDEENLRLAGRINRLNTILAVLSVMLALLSFDTIRKPVGDILATLSALLGIKSATLSEALPRLASNLATLLDIP